MANVEIQAGDYHSRLEEASKSPEKFPLDRIEQDLKKSSVIEVAVKYGLMTQEEAQHTQRDWYGPDRWWRDWDTERIVRESYLELLEIYRRRPRRVRTLWIAGVDTFRVLTDPGLDQITRIVLTPPVPSPSLKVERPGRRVS